MAIFSRLRAFLAPYKVHMVVVVISTLAVTVFSLAGPWVLREVVGIVANELGRPGAWERVGVLAVVLLATYVLRAVFEYFKSYIAHVMAWNYVSDLRVALYDHLQKLSLRYYSDKQTGEIMSRVVNDTTNIEPLIAHNIPDMIVNVTILAGITGILFYLSPQLALLTLIPIPLLVGVVWLFSGRMRDAFRVAQKKLADLNAVLQDNFSGMKEIQVFTREPFEKERVTDRSQGYTVKLLRALRLIAVYHPSVELAASLGTVIVLFFGGRAALAGTLPVEDLVAFFLYLSMFYQPVTVLARMNEQVQMALASSDRVAEVLDATSDVVEKPQPVRIGRARGRIEFQGVHFAYTEGNPVLKDVSFVVEPGETLALVGPTGVGKSTVASLIPRFYDPTAGRILLDGVDLRDLKLRDLRRNISMVLQDTFLFNGTVLENIMYGVDGATQEDVERAARIANAHDFIMELPDGYHTRIGERGFRLSGGQKQRLSIARAVLKDAPILILDEATSAVDVETEQQIQKALNRLMEGKTSIVIAHRLSTIRHADKIAVLDGGRIVEMGNHQELMARGTLYRRFVERQYAAASTAVVS
ncbi:MAG: ABC transporter ATP-binding protein [Limnochordales bacterium]|nr:MAG: ABC transporter ATP-binding protein [Bacillota bacterium]